MWKNVEQQKIFVRLCFIQNSSPNYHEIHHYAYY